MSLVKRVAGLFPVNGDETRSFRLLFFQSLFIGFAVSYYYTVSSSFLLKTVNIKILPNAYIITGTAGFFIIQQYKRLQRKYGIKGSFSTSLIVFAIVCVLNFFAMREWAGNKALAVTLAYTMVLFAAPFTTIFSLGVFAQCSRLYNIAQSKRLLALVVSGEIISSIVAFMSVSFLGPWVKSNIYVLMPVAGFFALLVFIPFNRLLVFANEKLTPPVVKKTVKVNFGFFRKDRFYMLIGITTFFSVFAIYAVDYCYLVSVRYMAHETNLQIAEIVSVFFVVLKIGELSTSFISGKVLSNKGVLFSLLLLPVALLILAGLAFLAGFLPMAFYIFLISFLLLSKIVERAVRKSVTTPSLKVMYQVAEPHERLEIEATVDGSLNQIATIVTGVLLLGVSSLFFKDDIYFLLHVFTFIGIVAFAGWSLSSLIMYRSYRVKIKDFLLKAKGQHQSGKTEVEVAEGKENEMALVEDQALSEKVEAILAMLRHVGKDALMGLIRIYNPRQSLELQFEKEDKVAKRLVHIFYSNNHYFSRLLIARYIQFCSEAGALLFLEDLWNVADITIRLELVKAFNEKRHFVSNRSFFERACEDCVREIIWVEATLFDTAELKSEELESDLMHYRRQLLSLLFELLKPMYDPSVIGVIADIILSDNADVEKELFAVELLDLTLEPALKEMIKPVLEPISFEAKKQKLGKLFYIYQLPPFDRLVDILMKDYNLVSLRLKETALIVYNKHTDGTAVLSAFRTNNIDSLRYKADGMYSGFFDPVYYARQEVIKRIVRKYPGISQYSPYVLNYGVTVQGPAHRGGRHTLLHAFVIDQTSSTNIGVKVDCLGLCLLLTMKQQQLSRPEEEPEEDMAEVSMA